MPVDDVPLGSLLRRHRSAAGLTQEQLAELAGVSSRAVSDVERGLRTRIYRDTATRLADALGLQGAERSEFEGLARGRTPPPRPPKDAEASPPAGTLPSRLTRLIGRERELEVVLALLADPEVRLLTLTGPGGIGKTRLAVEAASRAQRAFRGGVFFVSLAAAQQPELVPGLVAHAVGVRGPQGPVIEGLIRRLSASPSLLVLDTFEQVLSAAEVIAHLLRACPGLTVLVTSREALRLRAEHQFAVPTLPVPDRESRISPNAVDGYPAVAMFLDRARAVRPELVVDDDSVRLMAEVCWRVDGLPLAIELAAARVKHLPLRALRDHLEHGLSVLTGGPRDLPRRQQTMRDTIGWSYDLLEPPEKRMFRGLSVFAGGWTLQAAAETCTPEGHVALPLMSALVDKSLVTLVETAGGEPRYGMLDVIREFAAEHSDAAGETDELARRHAGFCLDLAVAAAPGYGGPQQERSFAEFDLEHDNLRAALRRAVGGRDADLGLGLAGASWQFWLSLGHHGEGRNWLRQVLAIEPQGSAALRMKALWGAAWLAYHQGDYEETAVLGAELLRLARTHGEQVDVRNALTVQGIVALARGRYAEALVPFREALAICRELEPGWLLATSLLNLGMASLHAGDLDSAREEFEEARAVYGRIRDQRFAARALQQLGYVGLLTGDVGGGRAKVAASLATYRGLNDQWGVAESLEGLSACDAAAGNPERAALLAGCAEALREWLTTRPLPFDRALTDRFLAEARSSVPEETWEAAWERGRAMPLDQVMDQSGAPSTSVSAKP
jgi:predicted ATPase/DNA-binding XRE family transcriptional regulator